MSSFNLPASSFREAPALPQHPAPALPSAPPDHPPPPAPVSTGLTFGRRALASINRLRASFARAEAVHQSRLDAWWNGAGRFLPTR